MCCCCVDCVGVILYILPLQKCPCLLKGVLSHSSATVPRETFGQKVHYTSAVACSYLASTIATPPTIAIVPHVVNAFLMLFKMELGTFAFKVSIAESTLLTKVCVGASAEASTIPHERIARQFLPNCTLCLA